ncbi:MAG: di-trans,poly-cis-decaprenylcistransferase [Bdellovibrionales bacterium]|nr:di-trans,poly-cis-decaprenylcistransferase [Bdellovibrionales bacterium]
MELPRHLAIIMDGNGRWAKSRGRNRLYGHIRGAQVAKQTIENCARLGIKNLTLFAFSTENWFRPSEEVSFLMGLMARKLKIEAPSLIKNNIRFHCIGNLRNLPSAVREKALETIKLTAHCTGMNLTCALSYGGRQEITAAARLIAEEVAKGSLKPENIDEALFAGALDSSFMPDPDLIIRTSGEHRLSNFFLWQAAYSEIHIVDKSWPEFSKVELYQALETFSKRERRFGKTSEQIKNSTLRSP